MGKNKDLKRIDEMIKADNFAVEQIMVFSDDKRNQLPMGLKFFLGEISFEFPGLGFDNIVGINIDGPSVAIEIKFGPTIRMRTDGWCKWD